jgi:hypothetical protein
MPLEFQACREGPGSNIFNTSDKGCGNYTYSSKNKHYGEGCNRRLGQLKLWITLLVLGAQAAWAEAAPTVQPADTAWMLVCTALVLLMTPALDYAGGTVVHINAGVAALILALYLGPRKEFGRQATVPHHVPSVLLGAALLWFGFNAGSALEANKTAVLAFVNTVLSPMAALVTWMLLDYRRCRQTTAVGAATGIVVGLVAITPAAGYM